MQFFCTSILYKRIINLSTILIQSVILLIPAFTNHDLIISPRTHNFTQPTQPLTNTSTPVRWNRVVKLCSDIAAEQLKLAGSKSRNYIIDQTNVYAAPRRQKLRIFENYKAIAAVLVVTDTELIKRWARCK